MKLGLLISFLLFCTITERSLIKDAWQGVTESLDPVGKSIATPFFQGMISGNLSLYNFSTYLVQDAYYLKQGAQLWEQSCLGANSANNEEYLTFCNDEFKNYEDFAISLRSTLGVRKEGIIPSDATKAYTSERKNL